MRGMNINRRDFMKAGAVGLSLCAVPRVLWGETSPAPTGTRPNILFVMTDDQGWMDVGYNGNKVLKTPNLDAMAAEGLRCDRFYAAAPVCSPTRGSCMTGRHPNRYALWDWGYPIRPQERTLGHLGREAGYRTGFFGKWHLNMRFDQTPGKKKDLLPDDPLGPGAMGFDHWLARSTCYNNNPKMCTPEGTIRPKGEGTDVTTDATIAFIDECVDNNKPFLAVCWTSNPHSSYSSYTKEDIAPYEEAGIKDAARMAEIGAIDRNVGRLRAHLRKREVADNTLFIFCSDNGSDRGNAPLLGNKKSLKEGGIRVPGLIEWPAVITEPRRTKMPINTSDLYPTFAELLGVSVPGQALPLDGISLVPLLTGKSDTREEPMFFAQAAAGETEGSMVVRRDAVVYGDLKLYRSGSARKASLVSLAEDGEPVVTKDHPETVAKLTAALDKWQESVSASVRGEDYPKV